MAVRMLTPERERWAEALHIHVTYGVGAGLHVAERVARLEAEQDAPGAERWRAIGTRVELLAGPGTIQ